MRGNAVADGFQPDPSLETNGNFLVSLNRAITQSGEKQEALAREAGCTPSYLSKVLAAQQGALHLLDRLPVGLQRRIAREYAESHGFTVIDPSPGELDARVFEACEQLVLALKLAKVGRPTQARANLDSSGRR
jgi:hypothetical protein